MDQVALQIPFLGGRALTIHWYGVFVAAGFLVGLWWASRRAVQEGIPRETIYDLGPCLVLGAILGARLLYVLMFWQAEFASRPWWEPFMVHHGGLVFQGGLVGSAFAFLAYAQWRRLDRWQLADILTPSIALGQAIGRVGCYMNGCCFGKACGLPWAVTFPIGHQAAGIPVHPTQLYETAANLTLAFGLAYWHRRRGFPGQVFALYLIAYAPMRAFIEFYRGDYPSHLTRIATPGQLGSIAILITGAALYVYLKRAGAARPAATSDR